MADAYRVGRENRLGEEVAESLLQRIVAGEFASGSTLPPEAVLSQAYGVSRPSMRDAIKILQEKGLVRTIHGIGSMVNEQDRWSILDPDVMRARLAHEDAADEIFDELTIVRIALESEMAALAAKQLQPGGRRRLSEHLMRMDSAAHAPDQYLNLDVAFHDLIVELSGNRFARAIMTAIDEPLRQSRRMTNRIPDGIAAAHSFHQQIAERICAADPDGAAHAMRTHLVWSWERYRAMRQTRPGTRSQD